MSRREPTPEVDLLTSQVAALEELLTVQEDTVARQTQRLLRAMEETREATRAKSEFLANMSHELRTPLNSVIGFSNILLKNKTRNLTAQQLTYLERIEENGRHLLSLINTILDLSKIESGHVDIESESVSLVRLVRETVEQLRGQATTDELELRVDVPPAVRNILTDERKLKQVIINLIANAIRFTREGSVTVRVRADPQSLCPTVIEVVDTGIGIPEDKLQSIFAAFEQADASTSREFGGTGLGLAISKSLCDLMGHRIEVESKMGHGSIFRIVLGGDLHVPGEQRPRSPQGVHEPALPPAGASPDRGLLEPTVLVIDDEADSRLLLSEQLEELGARVIAVSSGAEGLRVARARRPDVITLDLMMPELHGLEVLQAFKADKELRHIPVIVVSLIAEEHRSALLGTVELLSKPVARQELAEILQGLVYHEPASVLVVEDDADTQRLLRDYLEEEGLRVSIAGHGSEALAMLEQATPDLITLDLFMPEMDGFEFLSRLRKDQRHAGLPVIVLTAGTLTSDDRKRLAAQAQAVLEKGKDFAAELGVVLRSLRGVRWNRPAAGN